MQTEVIDQSPQFAVAGAMLEALSARDFERMGGVLDDDATLTALVPRGVREVHGATDIAAQFATWFGTAETFELVDASLGQVGALLHLRWRFRVTDATRGDGPLVVEQHAYATTGRNGRVSQLRLLCSGFWPEHAAV